MGCHSRILNILLTPSFTFYLNTQKFQCNLISISDIQRFVFVKIIIVNQAVLLKSASLMKNKFYVIRVQLIGTQRANHLMNFRGDLCVYR